MLGTQVMNGTVQLTGDGGCICLIPGCGLVLESIPVLLQHLRESPHCWTIDQVYEVFNALKPSLYHAAVLAKENGSTESKRLRLRPKPKRDAPLTEEEQLFNYAYTNFRSIVRDLPPLPEPDNMDFGPDCTNDVDNQLALYACTVIGCLRKIAFKPGAVDTSSFDFRQLLFAPGSDAEPLVKCLLQALREVPKGVSKEEFDACIEMELAERDLQRDAVEVALRRWPFLSDMDKKEARMMFRPFRCRFAAWLFQMRPRESGPTPAEVHVWLEFKEFRQKAVAMLR
ncbi:hypothetical protein HDU96_003544 [Phlyctochytrium bullatum]|nr:hypothetical protein HDU96_003544 [Phlyctochytrium bullatum]